MCHICLLPSMRIQNLLTAKKFCSQDGTIGVLVHAQYFIFLLLTSTHFSIFVQGSVAIKKVTKLWQKYIGLDSWVHRQSLNSRPRLFYRNVATCGSSVVLFCKDSFRRVTSKLFCASSRAIAGCTSDVSFFCAGENRGEGSNKQAIFMVGSPNSKAFLSGKNTFFWTAARFVLTLSNGMKLL